MHIGLIIGLGANILLHILLVLWDILGIAGVEIQCFLVCEQFGSFEFLLIIHAAKKGKRTAFILFSLLFSELLYLMSSKSILFISRIYLSKSSFPFMFGIV